MLDIKKVQSTNNVVITGILNELEIEEKVTDDGRQYVSGKASILVDQEVGGKVVENLIPVRMFSMRKKKDGTNNSVYDGIVKMGTDFTSKGSADENNKASRVTLNGASIRENVWIDKTTGLERSSFNIETNFMKKAGPNDVDKATFEVSGVVGAIVDEYDKEGNETGRLKIKVVVIGYMGRAEVVEFTAQSPAAINYIQNNWSKGDTISFAGVVNMSQKTVTVSKGDADEGFGGPITHERTETVRELIITKGLPPLEEALSYDQSSITLALDERKKRNDAAAQKSATKATKPAPAAFPGF